MNDLKGMGLAALAAWLWSSGFVAAAYLLGGEVKRIDPLTLIALRFIIGGAVIFGFAKLRKRRLTLRDPRQIRLCLAVAFMMYMVVSALFFVGQLTNTATVSALIVESGPVILVAAWNLLRRKSSRLEVGAVGVSLFGCLLVLNVVTADGVRYDTGLFWGQLALLASAVCWVVGSAWGQKLMNSGGDKLVLTAWAELLAGIMALPLMALWPNAVIWPSGWGSWGAVGLIALLPSALAFIAWSYALSCSELWKLTLCQNLTPVFTMLGAYLILGNRVTFLNILGMGIVFTGLVTVVLAGRRKQLRAPRPAPPLSGAPER